MAGVALMRLFPCSPPLTAAVSDQAQRGLCRAGSASPHQPFLGPAKTICSVLFQKKEKEFLLREA